MPEGDEGELEDVALAAAVSAPEVHLGEQHAQSRSRAFYRALQDIAGLAGTTEQSRGRRAAKHSPEPLLDGGGLRGLSQEAVRTGVLPMSALRLPSRALHQPRGVAGNAASANARWGLRAGTVAADSPLPLLAWFTAIRLLLANPTMGTTELGIKLGISRSTTVRNMARKVTAAMAEENASELLAGLDLYYARCPATPPESSAPQAENIAAGSEDIRGLPKSDASPSDTTG